MSAILPTSFCSQLRLVVWFSVSNTVTIFDSDWSSHKVGSRREDNVLFGSEGGVCVCVCVCACTCVDVAHVVARTLLVVQLTSEVVACL